MAYDFSNLVPVRLGADPEFFVTMKSTGGVVPAYLTGVTGTKANPQPLPSGGAVQVDGMALEFNIQPASTGQEFNENIETAMREIRELVSKDFNFSFQSSAIFGEEDFKNTPDQYKELGCEPDYSMYDRQSKLPPPLASKKPYRTAGGHIHVSWTKGMDIHDSRSVWDASILVAAYEDYLGNFRRDPDRKRRQLYGQVGSFRPKEYGLEWRSPSNWWLNWGNKERGCLFKLIQDITYKKICGLLGGRIADIEVKSHYAGHTRNIQSGRVLLTNAGYI